jgi:calcium-dependent protein kinase
MLAYDPSKRISAMDGLQHKWIREKAVAEKVTKGIATNTLKNLKNFRG